MMSCLKLLEMSLIAIVLVCNVHCGRITGGVEVEPHSVPFQIVFLRKQDGGKYICGGAIYDEVNVVTAAHCCYGSIHSVYGGVHNISKVDSEHQKIVVERVKKHEHYDGRRNDICMLHLSEPFTFNRYVQPAKFPRQSEPIRPHALAVATGWGQLKTGGPASKVLMGVELKVLSSEECLTRFGPYGKYDPVTMVCAGTLGKDTCKGDSGGPMTVDKVLVGITSWGESPCGSFPGVFARVAKYIDWLRNNRKIIQSDC